MADFDEYKSMVMAFRVSELQALLGYAGRNRSGRKQELLQRALHLLQKGSSMPLQIKIREIYRQIYPNQRRKVDVQPVNHGPEVQQILPGMTREEQCQLDYIKSLATIDPLNSPIPVHPDVNFERLPFYDILGDLVKPTSLVPKKNSRFQEAYFGFHLTPQQAHDIAMSRDLHPCTKIEYTVQIQLRFCLLETSCEQRDNFPPSICVRVNGKLAQLPNPIPTNKPGVEPKRPGRPVDITSICRLSPTVSNDIEITWASEFGRGYCLAIYLVKRLSTDVLLHKLKMSSNRHPDHTRALIKEKLSHDPESEVATTSLRVSLLCPLGKMRMTLPCRSSTCSHLQCFDASTYLMMNEKKPTWICPVCDKCAPFDKLIIDGYFLEICRKSSETNDIVFNENGNWAPVKQNKEMFVIGSPSVPTTNTASYSSSSSSSAAHSQTVANSQTGKEKHEVIDLTLDSSDDEDEMAVWPVNVVPSHGPSPSTSGTCHSPAVINVDALSPERSTPASPHPVSQPAFSMGPCIRADPPSDPQTQLPPQLLPSYPPPVICAPPSSTVGPPPLLAPSQVNTQGNLGPNVNNMGCVNLDNLSEAEFEQFLQSITWNG